MSDQSDFTGWQNMHLYFIRRRLWFHRGNQNQNTSHLYLIFNYSTLITTLLGRAAESEPREASLLNVFQFSAACVSAPQTDGLCRSSACGICPDRKKQTKTQLWTQPAQGHQTDHDLQMPRSPVEYCHECIV